MTISPDPGHLGDLLRAESCLDRHQEKRPIALRVAGGREVLEDAALLGCGEDFGLATEGHLSLLLVGKLC